MPVPYANLTNPQTLNLYAMVADDAETYADLDGHCCDLDDAIDYGVGVLRGFASSLTFGAVGAPKSEDSVSSRAGQGTGSVLAGITGEITADAGKGGMVAGLAAEAPSLGTSTTLVLAGAGAAAVGTAVEASAAANLARLATTPMQSSDKPGEVYVTEPQASGKPYMGRTTQGVDNRMETRTDGRTGKAATVDTYKTTQEGRFKEQKAIDERGGVQNLDNKRNEVSAQKMKELQEQYGEDPPTLE